MGKHRRNCSDSSSCDSSENSSCVGNFCSNDCGNCPPIRAYEPEVLSSIGCQTSCPPNDCKKLCDSTSSLTCPTVEHCTKVKKCKKPKCCVKCKKDPCCCKRGKCGRCGYGKCRCEDSCDWEKILCRQSCSSSSDSSDSCCACGNGDCCGDCGIAIPFPQYGHGIKAEWCDKTSSSSCPKQKKCKKETCHKKEECSKCCYPVENCRCKEKAKGKSFTVRLALKAGHPWEHRIVGTNRCITINDVKGPTLHLTNGHVYMFDVQMSDGSSFFFTTDPLGGAPGNNSDPVGWRAPLLPGAPAPISSGVATLKVTKDMPRFFYYQNNMHPCMGGKCITHSS